MEKYYRISFSSGEINFVLESSDKSWVEIKEKEYLSRMGLKADVPAKPSSKTPVDHKTPTIVRSISINEFFKKYIKPKNLSQPDTSVFFVYYLQRMQKKDEIRTADIIGCFREVGFPAYNKINVADKLYQARKKALLNYVNELWSLTVTGEDFVLNSMSGESK